MSAVSKQIESINPKVYSEELSIKESTVKEYLNTFEHEFRPLLSSKSQTKQRLEDIHYLHNQGFSQQEIHKLFSSTQNRIYNKVDTLIEENSNLKSQMIEMDKKIELLEKQLIKFDETLQETTLILHTKVDELEVQTTDHLLEMQRLHRVTTTI